MPNSVK